MADDSIPFTPVPGRARHDGWTPERQRRLLDALAATGRVAVAARQVGMTARSAYALRRRAGEGSPFALAWEAALDRNYRATLDKALPVALDGELVPVFYRGRQVGRYRRHNEALMVAILRAHAARGRRVAGEGG